MRTDITRLDIASRRRSLIGYALGMALYSLAVVALYPAFKRSTSLDSLVKNDPTAAALLGVTGPLSSAGGWLNGNIYANFFPLAMLLLTITYGGTAIAGQDEDGTLSLITTLPVRRAVIVLQKAMAMALQAAALAAVVAVCVLAGRSFGLTVSPGNVLSVSAATCLLGLDFGLITMAVGVATGRRATATGVGAAVAATSYLIGSLATVVSWLHSARYLSLFYWAVGRNQISQGTSLGDFAVLIISGLVALCATVIAFQRLDLH